MRAKPVASAWLTPREAARLVGWDKPDDDRKMIRALRRIEKKATPPVKVLHIVVTPRRTRLMVTMAGLRRAMPDKFLMSEEQLPVVLAEKFAQAEKSVESIAERVGAHGSKIRCHAMRLTALEAIMKKLERGELRLVKGGLK